jgi:hypothetical protein
LRNACDDVGRDPNTLDVTANVSVAFPDLGKTTPFAKNPLLGTVESLAQAFQRYSESGVAHLIIQHTPSTLPALERLIEVVHLYRNMAR